MVGGCVATLRFASSTQHVNVHWFTRNPSTLLRAGFFVPQGPIVNRSRFVGAAVRKAVAYIRPLLRGRSPLLSASQQPPEEGISLFSRSQNRLILNQAALERELGTLGAPKGLNVLRMETATFAEQAFAVSRSSIVVGMHGSALIMAAFMRSGSILVEIFPFGVPVDNYTPSVDDQRGLPRPKV